MANLLVDERDARFTLYEQLRVQDLCGTDKYAEFSTEIFNMALEAAQKLAENELWPINADGDRIGVKLDRGQVRVPQSFHRMYQLYCEGGWQGVSIDQEHGGQGLPISVCCAALEMFCAANLGFMGYPGLTIGAARVIQVFGSEEQRSTYMEHMVSGQWAGTMCLTEPQAGSDVGALRTKARKNADGAYSIAGSKIFITGGDHDLTENIVHLVLARIEGAAPGAKGISIFIVPKKRIQDGVLVDNDVTTVAVESKLGLHGSATCALNFGEQDNCVGYLVGEENAGMAIMFQMMNEARLAVGLQGLALASGSYMQSLKYAVERLQGPHFSAMKDPQAPKVAIIDHPDVRRMLMWMKCMTEGMRSLLYFAGHCEDLAATASNREEAEKSHRMVEFLIPVCKAWSSDVGFRVTELGVQIHGGYGYCSEYPMEQFLRDVKITSIYEGTNGIQALDLVGRKLRIGQGALFQEFMGRTGEMIEKARLSPRLGTVTDLLEEARSQLMEVTTHFAQKAMSGDPLTAVLYATPYLELVGDVAVGYMLLWQADVADGRLQEIFEQARADTAEKRNEVIGNDLDAAFYRGKVASAEFFANTVLSLAKGKARAIMNGGCEIMELPKEAFVR
jgi:alkylation response protein AidB-like acyl-CoA dehydrogenase